MFKGKEYLLVLVLLVAIKGSDACFPSGSSRRRSPPPTPAPPKPTTPKPNRGGISDNCMDCICQVEGCQSQLGKCRMDVGSLSCGPFQIKEAYYTDCGEPGSGWQSCTKTMGCSRTCVAAYANRWGKRCTGSRYPTCQDYARNHNGGPRGCQKSSTVGYWQKVKACCDAKGGC